MKILVTGTTGQLGYDVMKALAERRIEAIGAGRGDFDITDAQTARSFIIKHHPDAVIHCAAYTAVDKAEEDEDLCRRVNVDGTVTIATVCRDIGAKMIYISTDYVFPGTGHQFYEVDAPKGPLNLYGQSKLDGEEAVKNLLQHYFIVRTSWAFGLNGGNFVKTMLRLGRGRKEINVVCDQIGSPTYTADLASLLCNMVVTDKYGVYHATNEGICSWAEFAKEIFRLAEYDTKINPVPSSEYPTKALRPLNSRMSKRDLDRQRFKKLPTWQNALKRYLVALAEL